MERSKNIARAFYLVLIKKRWFNKFGVEEGRKRNKNYLLGINLSITSGRGERKTSLFIELLNYGIHNQEM